VAVPIVNHFFGIQPKAHAKSISLSPRLPRDWKEVAIKNVKVGNNEISLAITVKQDSKEYRIQQLQPNWSILIDVANAKKIVVNDETVELKTITNNRLTLTGANNTIVIY
jgi:cellobiose phosphorylase